MKIRANRAELSDAIGWVASAISRKPHAPAMSGMKITAEGDTLTLRAFDFEVSHTASLSVEVGAEGECLVSGQFVKEIVGSLKGAEVELILDGDRLTINSGRSTYGANALRLDEYPSLPEFPTMVGKVSADDLAALVAAVKHPIDDSTPHDQVRGLRIEGSAGELRAVGASRFAIATAACTWRDGGDLACQVPIRAAESAIKGMRGEVTIGSQGGTFGLSDDTRAVTMRTYDGEYVAWSRLIRPTSEDAMACEVDPAELLQAVKRGGLLTDETLPITLAITPSEIQVSASDGEYGHGDDFVDCSGDAQILIGFDPRYLGDALAAVPSGLVSIGLIEPGKPITIRPQDHPHMTFVVMPKTIKGNA